MESKSNIPPKYPIHSLCNALDVLDYVYKNGNPYGCTLQSISSGLNIGKSTVHRILDTLLYYGYVEKSSSSIVRYQLSWPLYELASGVTRSHTLETSDCAKYADALALKLHAPIHVNIYKEDNIFVIYNAYHSLVTENHHSTLLFSERYPLYASASGKLFLLDYTNEEISNYFRKTEIKRFTQNTILNYLDFLDNLKLVKKKGYSIELQEYDRRIHAAMPIKDYTNKTIATISVECDPSWVNGYTIVNHSLQDSLFDACSKLSDYLGYKSSTNDDVYDS